MCVSVCVCVTEVGSSGGGTIVVTRDLDTYYTLYCVCMITSGCIRRAAPEEDAVMWTGQIGEQQAEADAVRSDHARLVLARDTSSHTRCQSRGLHQTHADVVKEVRPQKHNYMSAAQRELLCAMLCWHEWKWELLRLLLHEGLVSSWIASSVDCIRRDVWNRWTGLLEWNTGMA